MDHWAGLSRQLNIARRQGRAPLHDMGLGVANGTTVGLLSVKRTLTGAAPGVDQLVPAQGGSHHGLL